VFVLSEGEKTTNPLELSLRTINNI